MGAASNIRGPLAGQARAAQGNRPARGGQQGMPPQGGQQLPDQAVPPQHARGGRPQTGALSGQPNPDERRRAGLDLGPGRGRRIDSFPGMGGA